MPRIFLLLLLLHALATLAQPSPYQTFLDQASNRVIRKGFLQTRAFTELLDIPTPIAASTPLLGASMSGRWESTANAVRCVVASQRGRTTTVDRVQLQGFVMSTVGGAAVDNAEDPAVDAMHPGYALSVRGVGLTRAPCVSPRAVLRGGDGGGGGGGAVFRVNYTVPVVEVGEGDVLRERLPESMQVGQLIEACDGFVEVGGPELACEADVRNEVEVTIFPDGQLADPQPAETVKLAYEDSVYVLQVVTVMALALETLFLVVGMRAKVFAQRAEAARGGKSSSNTSGRLITITRAWLAALAASTAVLVVTAALATVEVLDTLQDITRGYVRCRADGLGASISESLGNVLSAAISCEVIRVSSTVHPKSFAALLGPLLPCVAVTLAAIALWTSLLQRHPAPDPPPLPDPEKPPLTDSLSTPL